MLLPREFFESLKDGDEYFSILIKRDDYGLIPQIVRENAVVNSVKKKNLFFNDDLTHKALAKKARDSKKALMDYEFKMNY